MRSTIRGLASLAALTGAVCLAGAGFAQDAPSGAPPSAAAHEHWAEHMREHVEARAKRLHDILNIQPGQDVAFQAFIASMTPPEGEGGPHGHHDMAEMQALTTPERLDRMADRMAKRQAQFQRRADAVKAFYAALDPGQKRAFDALHGMMRGGHHGGGHGFGGHGWGGPEGRDDGPHPQG
jgi:protein CpxP